MFEKEELLRKVCPIKGDFCKSNCVFFSEIELSDKSIKYACSLSAITFAIATISESLSELNRTINWIKIEMRKKKYESKTD